MCCSDWLINKAALAYGKAGCGKIQGEGEEGDAVRRQQEERDVKTPKEGEAMSSLHVLIRLRPMMTQHAVHFRRHSR
ncbi:hypothetical protein STEG23_011931 [Scotinomys teguina]